MAAISHEHYDFTFLYARRFGPLLDAPRPAKALAQRSEDPLKAVLLL
jgi:hypothetical protein